MLNLRVPEQEVELRPRITVIGVGGGGSNAVNNMIRTELQGVEFLVCNTDAQSLKMSLSDRKIQLGNHVTRGLGAGASPNVGRAAAEEAMEEIMGYLEGSNMVFITAGMGGGTGTGAAPVIARAAKEQGILTVGVVTKPFHFEGAHRMRLAEAGIEELQQHVDTLLIIPNQNLFRIANEKTTFADAFKMADEVLHAGVRGVTDLMVMPGLINLDFADIRSVMSEMGKAMMGTGEASGDRRAIEAAEAAINNPLLEDASMQGAKGLLINITGGMDMTLFEVDEACNRVRDEVDPDANIIFGSTFNPELDGKIRVSVVATGIESAFRMRQSTTHTGFSTEVAQTPAAKSGFGPSGQFGRGVTLRSGQGSNQMAPAPINTTGASVQQQATPAQQFTAQPQQPRTTTTAQQQQNNYAAQINSAARATAAMQNATSPAAQSGAPLYGYGRTGNTALKVQEEFVAQPITIGSLEHDTAEAFGAAAEDMNAYQPQSHRGERDGDSFIPPMPMMTEAKTVSATGTASAYAAPQRQPQQTNYSAAQEFAPSVEHYVAAPIAQQATPIQAQVQAPAPVVEPKRASLFDRLTGNTGSAAPKQQAAPVQQPAQQPTSSAVIKTQTPSPSQQPALAVDNSDRIPATSSFDDDLDIPAFLRRQSS